jgi:hypothetical protein
MRPSAFTYANPRLKNPSKLTNFTKRSSTFSLSLRERAGVRGK